jgi:hypothetical protein
VGFHRVFTSRPAERSDVAGVVLRALSPPIELQSSSTDRMPSFPTSFATIADAAKIARFLAFFQGYSLWFFHGKVSTLEAFVDRSAADSLRPEESFDPVRTKIDRKTGLCREV